MTGGVAVFDYNNDGFVDIFFTNGAAIPSLEKSDSSYSNRLFRNNGDGTFTDNNGIVMLACLKPHPNSLKPCAVMDAGHARLAGAFTISVAVGTVK